MKTDVRLFLFGRLNYTAFLEIFSEHILGCCNGSSSNFEFYLLLRRLLKSNRAAFLGKFHQSFPNDFDSLIQRNQAAIF